MTLKHNFDEIVDRRGTNSSKWLKYPADVLPMWIADSDFRCAQPIVDEMKRLAEHGSTATRMCRKVHLSGPLSAGAMFAMTWILRRGIGGLLCSVHVHSPRGRGEGVLRTG